MCLSSAIRDQNLSPRFTFANGYEVPGEAKPIMAQRSTVKMFAMTLTIVKDNTLTSWVQSVCIIEGSRKPSVIPPRVAIEKPPFGEDWDSQASRRSSCFLVVKRVSLLTDWPISCNNPFPTNDCRFVLE